MAESNETPRWFWLAAGLGALAGGGGILALGVKVVATNSITLAWILEGALALGAALAALLSVPPAVEAALKALKRIERTYPEELKRLRNRTPTLAAVLCLVSTGYLAIADEAFPSSPGLTIIFALALTLVFYISNTFLEDSSFGFRLAGALTWLVGMLLLPAAVMLDRRWSVPTLVQAVLGLDAQLLASIAVIFLLLAIAPFVVRR
jgi:hypothetical protein